jgi:hypothetical protein
MIKIKDYFFSLSLDSGIRFSAKVMEAWMEDNIKIDLKNSVSGCEMNSSDQDGAQLRDLVNTVIYLLVP